MVKPFSLLDLIFREVPSDYTIAVTGSDKWGPDRWAAYERLPCVLAKLIDDSGCVEDVDMMIDEALRATSRSITPEELKHEPCCELLVQVMWILITDSQRTRKNMETVKKVWNVARNNGLGVAPSNIAKPCDALRRRASELRGEQKRQNKLFRRDEE